MGTNIHSIIKFKESQVHCISGHFKDSPFPVPHSPFLLLKIADEDADFNEQSDPKEFIPQNFYDMDEVLGEENQ